MNPKGEGYGKHKLSMKAKVLYVYLLTAQQENPS